MKKITTVLGDIEPVHLGFCQIHEHVLTEATPASAKLPKLRIDRFDASLQEMRFLAAAGGRSLVDAQPIGAGRSANKLAELSRQSGLQVIASTGFHRPFFYRQDHWIVQTDSDTLTALFASEITTGCFNDGASDWPQNRTAIKAGMIKAAIGAAAPDELETRLLKSAIRTAKITGAAMQVHVESARAGLAVLDLAGSMGLAFERLIICHADRQHSELQVLRRIAALGANLELDTIARPHYHDDEAEIQLILALADDDYLPRLMLSLDTTAERMKAYGGTPGLDYLISDFLPRLISAGLTPKDINQMMIDNPAAILSRDVNEGDKTL